MKPLSIGVLAATALCAFVGGACTEPQAPVEAARLSVAAALVTGPTLDGLQVSWVSTNSPWFTGSLFTSPSDPYHDTDNSVTTGSSLSFYLAFLASSFDPAASIPVEVRFDAASSQRAYRVRRPGSPSDSRYLIQSTNSFVSVPFTVWDVSTPASPRQLTVAWRDQNNSGTWDPATGSSLEVVFIYNKTYDPTGTLQFSMPPASIYNETTIGANADIIYGLSVQVLAGHSLSESTGTLAIQPSFVLFPSIDIKPGSDPNSANCLNPNELIPVALLTTADFDASQVDPSTVGFGPARAPEVHRTAHVEDVDGDGDLDRVFHFRNSQTGLTCDDTQATLFGRLDARTVIRGTDKISFVQTIRSFPATISPTNPKWGDIVTITAGKGFSFSPMSTVTWPEGAAFVMADSVIATTIRMVPHWGSAGAPTITGVIAAKYPQSMLTLVAVLPEPFAVQAVAGNLPGTSTLSTAPLVAAPGFINAGVFEGTADCRVSAPCQLYKLNVAANGFKTFTITWSNTDDLGLYFLNATGSLLSYFNCDRFGIGATSQPETCTVPVVAGTMYLELSDYGPYYPGGAAANPPPLWVRAEFN